ncbi:hypothetical protein ROG8370_02023 [Roseovarius gaetbuli]|uniref:Uncharacterized protein n=1 Tax=Roseovarius gaetbuli TaxID=1356575 RepID=A0A1X6ZB66_9RHOB|nr:hypothetical protein [Roseovarius gaetbuli]SLN46720.1 hypothetical protein ROG8370_02023 [Roseovarius gaetbuli]
MTKKTEYLITCFDRNGNKQYELRAPKGANPRLLLERLICRDLDDDTLIASCLRKNAKRAYDPFQIIDMREEHRREQAQGALRSDPNTNDPIGVYNRAREAPIPSGKTLLIAGLNHDFFIKEVET